MSSLEPLIWLCVACAALYAALRYLWAVRQHSRHMNAVARWALREQAAFVDLRPYFNSLAPVDVMMRRFWEWDARAFVEDWPRYYVVHTPGSALLRKKLAAEAIAEIEAEHQEEATT